MKEAVIDNESTLKQILEACEKGGHWRVACLSNMGMTYPRARITLLPNSAFIPGSDPQPNEFWLNRYRDLYEGCQ